jgi:enoyl-CoA hydratase
MGERTRYRNEGGIGWIDIDDGKVNVMSPVMQSDIGAALDQAAHDGVVVVLRGRPGVFSAGFDLGILGANDGGGAAMVLGGFELARRVLAHPRPVVIACTGHAVAMGLFLLLSGDYRIGVAGSARLTANEVAIGLTLPRAAMEVLRQRLTPATFQRAALLAEVFDPAAAVPAGILDEVVTPERFDERVAEVAAALTQLDIGAQRATKGRVRAPILDAVDRALAEDRAEYGSRLATSGTPTG